MANAQVWGGAALVLCLALACSSDRNGPDEATTATDIPTAASVPVESRADVPAFARVGITTSDTSLDELYRDCLIERGFDPEGVQVLIDETGTPRWVKTGHNVPSGLHGACFEAIGGATTATSYGTPVDESDAGGWITTSESDAGTSGIGVATYSWHSHVESLGSPELGSPTGGIGVQDDYRATHRRVGGLVSPDMACGITLAGRYTFVNLVWDEQSITAGPTTQSITYLGNREAPFPEPLLLAQGDWIVADILRIVDPAVQDFSNYEGVASMDFVSVDPNARCTSAYWVVVLDVLEHIPRDDWNPDP